MFYGDPRLFNKALLWSPILKRTRTNNIFHRKRIIRENPLGVKNTTYID